MTSHPPPLPLSRRQVVDRYFLEHRAKILDLAAFLDRVDRARDDREDGGEDAGEDFRMRSFRAAIALLLDGEPERARRILDLMSDPSTEPIPTAPMKGATGAWEGFEGDAEGSVG